MDPLEPSMLKKSRGTSVKARPLTSDSRPKHPRLQSGRHSARSSSRETDTISSHQHEIHNPLTIQSNPIHLATRSLSARLLTGSAPSSTSSRPPSIASLPSSARSTGSSSLPRESTRNKSKKSKATHKSTSNTQALKYRDETAPGNNVNEPVHSQQLNSTAGGAVEGGVRGFNIAGHLRDSVELDRSLGSLSPDVDQFLKDIGAMTLTPDPAKAITREVKVQPSTPNSETNVDQGVESMPPSVGNGASMLDPTKHNDTSKVAKDPPQKPRKKLKLVIQLGEMHQNGTQEIDGHISNIKPTGVPKLDLHSNMSPTDLNTETPSNSYVDLNKAAAKIQKWYRKLRTARYASVKTVLLEKRDELNRSKVLKLELSKSIAESQDQEEMAKKQRREAKMQATRQAAIDDLHKKREEKRLRTERIALEEIAFLKANGKIKKHKSSQRKPPKTSSQSLEAIDCQRPIDDVNHLDTPEHVIDEFFQVGGAVNKKQSQSVPAPPRDPPPQLDRGNTYNDILQTLKLLEEVPAPLSNDNECGIPTAGGNLPEAYLSADNLKSLARANRRPLSVNTSANLPEGKLHSILAYLDEMEQADQNLLSQLSQSRSEVKTKGVSTAGNSGNTPVISVGTLNEVKGGASVEANNDQDASLKAATAAASDVTSTILAQRIELDNKNKTVEMLQKALNQQRELTVYHAKEMDKDGQKKIDLLRTEYESRLQRHQAFIDQLIDDKKILGERCEQLVKELRELDKKYKAKLKSLEEKHSTEVSKLKQVSAAADKLRREKWKADETQRIKEATVKSLEPEIQRIIAKGKAELQRVKALHEAEMMQVDERASRRFVAQMEELRAQCAEEKEHACAHERELARQRYEKLAEQEEINYQQLRRKLFAEVQEEKNRLADQFQQQKVSTELRIDHIQQAQQRITEELKSEHAKQTSEMERRHKCDRKDLQERSKVERQAWEENLLRRQEASVLGKEREIREQLKKERDKEIELVITRLEEETTSSKDETERAAEARIRRVRDKYEAELREVERSERIMQEKFSSLKTQVVEHEAEQSRLRTLLRQKQDEVERVSEVASKLTHERDNVADIVRQEFADRLVRTDEDNKELKIEMSELRARHKVELEKVSRDKNREMESVHERVKQALSKKEEHLHSLREQYEAALKRADHLEMLLEQQRKQLLKK